MNAKYSRQLEVYEKQNRGEHLTGQERRWKKKYNADRVQSVKVVDGVKVTRYKPNIQVGCSKLSNIPLLGND